MRFILALVFLSSCAGTGDQAFDTSTFYRRDVLITDGATTYIGAAVLPFRSRHTLDMKFSGNLDLFTFTDCHQQIVRERAGKGGIFRAKNEIRINYEPRFAEGTYCPIEIGGYEALKGRHAWGFVDFKTSLETLPAKMECNGSMSERVGVSICQSLQGLLQRITFPTPTEASTDPGCDALVSEDGLRFEFPIVRGRCVYAFRELGGDRRYHRLTTLGYEKILIKEVRP